ncbi:MAG: hypothetical protein ACTHNA_14150 [Sphingopyxis terrae]|uniref:hypothetical protein n=1 Tax=Sphingopyxis terrae TaxID=33052 RepID=UPI003F81034F
MRIRALHTFTIALPDQMVVLNAAKGKVKADEADIEDSIAQQYIDAGMAEPAKGKPAKDPLDHDGDGRKGGVAPAAEPTKDEASNEAAEDKAP